MYTISLNTSQKIKTISYMIDLLGILI